MDIVVIGFNQLFQTAQQPECPPYRQPCLSEETGAPARMSGMATKRIRSKLDPDLKHWSRD